MAKTAQFLSYTELKAQLGIPVATSKMLFKRYDIEHRRTGEGASSKILLDVNEVSECWKEYTLEQELKNKC